MRKKLWLTALFTFWTRLSNITRPGDWGGKPDGLQIELYTNYEAITAK